MNELDPIERSYKRYMEADGLSLEKRGRICDKIELAMDRLWKLWEQLLKVDPSRRSYHRLEKKASEIVEQIDKMKQQIGDYDPMWADRWHNTFLTSKDHTR